MKLSTLIHLGLVVGASLAPCLPARAFENFITRRGDRLHDGEAEFRFMGANMPGLVLPYDYTLYLPERLRLPTPWEQEDAFKTLDQMNGRVVRTWNLPIRDPKKEPADGGMTWHYVQGPGQFNDDSFKTIDHLFALANKYNVRVIFDLTAEYGDYLGGIRTYAAHRGKDRPAFYTDPQLKEDYRATLRYVLGRTNTVTGVAYRDEKAVLAWQFGNEMHSAPDEWLSEMAAYIKKLAPNHLVAETRHRPGQPLLIDPNIDLLTRHLYSNYKGVEGGWIGSIRKEMEQLKGQRPMFIGEFGPYIDGKMFTHENVVDELRGFLNYVESEKGIPGALLWSMYFHHEGGGFYWHQIMTYPAVWSYHWPGFPSAEAQREIGIMTEMRNAAFRIQGQPIAPMPLPDPPEMLPATDVPMFSWRGSAGARGYDIQRAPAASGPWEMIAENVSDADVAYRPLFSDERARVGEIWYYRAVGRNESGASAPSAPIGPVKVRRICFVDEMQDFTRVRERSPGMDLDNDYNALFAEYLFRARGKAGDWVTYEVPGPADSLKLVMFFAKEITDPEITVSADGVRYERVQPQRRTRPLPAPPGGAAKGQRRTLVEYECPLPATAVARHLKLLLNGPSEIDRVEIYHQ